MKVIVTCGPSSEPIDQVRRITNFSTGELGVLLSFELTRFGFEVFCFKGHGSIYPGPAPVQKCHLAQFDTNVELLQLLAETAASNEIAAVFHAAALCDYKVERVEDGQGRMCNSPKIATKVGALTLNLVPSIKVINHLRKLFPASLLIGWKYELVGTRGEALQKAACQIEDNATDICVLNGEAYGPGFAVCRNINPIHECQDKVQLVKFLSGWLHQCVKSNARTPLMPVGAQA